MGFGFEARVPGRLTSVNAVALLM